MITDRYNEGYTIKIDGEICELICSRDWYRYQNTPSRFGRCRLHEFQSPTGKRYEIFVKPKKLKIDLHD